MGSNPTPSASLVTRRGKAKCIIVSHNIYTKIHRCPPTCSDAGFQIREVTPGSTANLENSIAVLKFQLPDGSAANSSREPQYPFEQAVPQPN